ncbi:winged helix-turn-helix transcriptional regulator [Marinomonas profundimaris]|uniref:HxlR family transcriptional regulator n=1 Tax=Marinomonas profundimaris TaxID=1208321 RepID=W1RSN1_9GAMM|nr:helix-turn-helix domain-containing protein [Marinomonas profundimaris]ETI59780.1 HxlR family transcriptional regulator [Marinomonas profundimaris]
MKKILDMPKPAEKKGLSAHFERGDVFSDKCPSRDVLKHVTSRWGVLIFIALKDGKSHRFSELRRTINGVSEKMLAQTLQALEQDGFVLRISYPVVPPHVEYSLTDSGKQVADRVVNLADWIEENIVTILANQSPRSNEIQA